MTEAQMGRWYMINRDGMATLCADREDAEKEAKDADMAWPHSGPHRAVQLVEASTAGFTAADMATASAQGFRDGVASVAASAGEPSGHIKEPYTLAEVKAKIASNDYSAEMLLQHAMLLLDSASIAANAGEPVAHLWQHCETGRTRIVMPDMIVDADASWQVVGPLYLGAAPPTAQAEGWKDGIEAVAAPQPAVAAGWQSIETAPKDSGYLLLRGGREQDVASGYWLQAAYAGNGAWIWPFVHMTPRFWAPLPPTPAEGV